MSRFEELLKEENLIPKYEMRVIDRYNQIYDDLFFTSLTDFHYFLNSDHYNKVVNRTDDRIVVVDLETDEVVFNTEKGD